MQQQLAQRTTEGPIPDLLIESGPETFLVDVKTPTNMWDYDHVQDHGRMQPVDYRQTVGVFPPAEQQALYLLGMGYQ
jgi:hypothetical protein